MSGTLTRLLEYILTIQCSKLRVHPAPGVHILAAGCMDFKPCAPGMCMYIPNYEYLHIEMCTLNDGRVHGFVYLCTRRVHGIIIS